MGDGTNAGSGIHATGGVGTGGDTVAAAGDLPDGALLVIPVDGIGEVGADTELAALLGDAVASLVRDGDILAVTSKVVSKAEGRLIAADDREDAITAETARLVARREHPGGVTRIVEHRLGLVLAAAGVDSSNVPPGTVLLLPLDPDDSARRLRAALQDRFGIRLGVVVTDTLGRPWREGQTDVAIGAAGLPVLDDSRGTLDSHGRVLEVSAAALVDEIAAAADLVKGKTQGRPVAIVRGLGHRLSADDGPGARSLVRPAERDMFRLGSDEAERIGYQRGLAEGLQRASLADAPATSVPPRRGHPDHPVHPDQKGPST